MEIEDTKPKVHLPFFPKNRKSHGGIQKSSFKDHVDALAGHIGLSLKKEGPAMARAMRNGKEPIFLKVFTYEREYQESMTRRGHLWRTITVLTNSSLSTAFP